MPKLLNKRSKVQYNYSQKNFYPTLIINKPIHKMCLRDIRHKIQNQIRVYS